RQHEATPLTEHEVAGRLKGSPGRPGSRGFDRVLGVALAQQPAQVVAGEAGAAQVVDLNGEVPDVASEFPGRFQGFEKNGQSRPARGKYLLPRRGRGVTVGVAH